MSVMLNKLRVSNPVAFAAVSAKAKELASLQKILKGDKADIGTLEHSQIDERLRLQMEWNRASVYGSEESDDLATLAMITLFPSQPHPEI